MTFFSDQNVLQGTSGLETDEVQGETRGLLRLLPLRLMLKSDTLSLDFFSGPLWRSGLGLALKHHFPGVFDLLFATHARLGRLYALQPPFAPVHPGECFELGLTLFGDAAQHAIACTQALAQLGEMGLGERRGKYALVNARVAGSNAAPFFDASAGLVSWPTAICPTRWLEQSVGSANLARVVLLTPLCIKDNNVPMLAPPEFTQFVRRLHGRLAQLCEAAGEASPLTRPFREAQLRLAADVRLQHSELKHEVVKRRSALSGQSMSFEGLTGSLTYRGDIAPFAGLLSLGKILQLGGKTAFGFGRIDPRFSFED